MKALFLACLIFTCLIADAQRAFQFDLSGGPGFNQNLHLQDEKVDNAGAIVFLFGSAFRFTPFKTSPFSLETGIYGKFIRNHAQIDQVSFKSQTLRSAVILLAGYPVSPKWQIAAGTSFQNNRDYNDIFVNQAYNFRFDAILMGQYKLFPKMYLTLRYCQSISRLGDPYFVNDPEFALLGGIRFTTLNPDK